MSLNCKFCNKECKNHNSLLNHERCCKENPNRTIPASKLDENGNLVNCQKGKTPWNKGLTKYTDERVARGAEKSSIASKGRPGRPHTQEEKEKLRESAIKHHLGGRQYKHAREYNGTIFDSSWEVTLAKNLDENQIKWERGMSFPYTYNNISHLYYPDFYLPDFDVYLDPKNSYLTNYKDRWGLTGREKIELASTQNNLRIILLKQDELNWAIIQTLI